MANLSNSTTMIDTPTTSMMVKKRNGNLEPVDLNKIVKAVEIHCKGLSGVDSIEVATRTISGLHDGATTAELDRLSIQTASTFIVKEPNYSKLAARLLSTYIDKEVRNQGIGTFGEYIQIGAELGLINAETADLVQENAEYLEDQLNPDEIERKNYLFEFFGLKTVYDRYLLRHPETRKVIENPQYFFMRVACGLSVEHGESVTVQPNVKEAVKFYELMSSLQYLPSSPTLFNSGTVHTQMSSCYLLDSPEDNLKSIYNKYGDIAQLSKFAGGIGLSYSRIRSRGSLIKGTNGKSNGIIPWLKVLDSSVSAVNQGGRRKGAACVYLESWHADIEEFLELRDNTGDEAFRAHNLNLANWVPDLFMHRVKNGWKWSLFDPRRVPELVDLYGEEFEKAYQKAEADGLAEKEIDAQALYQKMLRTLAQTGNGWMTFKDTSNKKCNQVGEGRVVHLSNLCTEILEVTNKDQTAVCNLGSVNLARLIKETEDKKLEFDFERLEEIVRLAVPFLDRVIDINFYPTPESSASNYEWRPVGLGLMGLQDVFFKLGLNFDSEEAKFLSNRISEEIYYSALSASCDLAEQNGAYSAYEKTRVSQGLLQMDLWDEGNEGPVKLTDTKRWEGLRKRIKEHGLRNSLLVAIAPTATIASIAGCYECIEPQISNLFKRETLTGEFMQVNTYLVRTLQDLGMWDEDMRNEIKTNAGSIQSISRIPEEIRGLYRTVWEYSMKSLIDLASGRGPFIDQSQSLNLFIANPDLGKLSSMYMYAWESGIKTTYYLRSKAATRISHTGYTETNLNGNNGTTSNGSKEMTQEELEALQCSLENPETCESCQ